MFLLSLVYLNFHGNSLKCPLRVTNCCISLGPRQVVPHMPVLIQVLFLCWSGTKHSCWETQNCCQLSRRLLFRCLSFKHVQDIQFSSVTTFFLIFIPVFPSEKNIIRNVKTSLWSREKTVCISSDSKTSTDFSVQVFLLTTPPRLLRRWDFLLYRSCSWTWVGRNSSDFIHAVHNPPCLPSCTNCWLLNPQGEGQDKKHFQRFERMELTRQENVSLKARINNTKVSFPFQEAERRIVWKCAVLMDSLRTVKIGVSENAGK